jgi:hypothetical protein
VEANSDDYIFESSGAKDKSGKRKPYIEDYGRISDNGLTELCCRAIDGYYGDGRNELFKNYLMKKLANRLGVTLRKKPLTENQVINRILGGIK